MYKLLFVVFFLSILSIVGCSMFADKWPAEIPEDLVTYAGGDPNTISLLDKNIGGLNKWILKGEITHQLTLAQYDYLAQIDNINYTIIHPAAVTTLETVLAEREAIIGQEGWLTSVLLLLAGGGGAGSVVNFFKNKTMYSESEVEKIKNGSVSSTSNT